MINSIASSLSCLQVKLTAMAVLAEFYLFVAHLILEVKLRDSQIID